MTEPELIFQNPKDLDPIPDGRYAFFDDYDGSLLVKTYKGGRKTVGLSPTRANAIRLVLPDLWG